MYPSLLNMFQRKRLLSPPDDEESNNQEDTSFQDLVPPRETPFLTGLREHLGALPQREDYNPSFGRKLLSGLLGSLGSLATKNAGYGVNLADQFANAKYNNALSDFATKEKVLREGAGLENQQLNRDISYAGRLGTFRHQRNTEDETKRYHDAQVENQLADNARAEDEGANRQNNADRAYEASKERLRLYGERNSILRSKVNKPPKPPKPPSQLETNRQATSALLRDYPEYGGFLNQSGQPKPPKSTGDANQDQLLQTQYSRFLTHYQLYMNKYNKTQNTSQFPDLPIEELYDDDSDNENDNDEDDMDNSR